MSERARWTATVIALAGATAAGGGAALARAGIAPFPTWLYQTGWYGLLAAAAAGLALRTGRRPVTAAQGLSLLLWSVPFWYLFEAANFRLANWYYVLLPAGTATRWVGCATAFATVLPALYLAHRWTTSLGLGRGWRTRGFRLRPGHLWAMGGAGAVFVALALWRPGLFYPLIWGALTLLLEPWNCRRDPDASLLADLARGRPGRILRLVVAGLGVGVVWEALNALARARWIYTVPGLEGAKLFEMPVPGYLGFPVLALDAFVAYRALVHLGVAVPAWTADDPAPAADAAGPSPAGGAPAPGPTSGQPAKRRSRGESAPSWRRATGAAVVAVVFSVAVQAGMDRWTVDSYAVRPAGLPGVTDAEAGSLRSAGIETVSDLAGADSTRLARASGLAPTEAGAAVRAARLARLRGMGAENTAVLWEAGIRSVCDLAAAGPREISRAVRRRRSAPRAGELPRVRVWLRAARESCPCGC